MMSRLKEVRLEGQVFVIDLDERQRCAKVLREGIGWLEVPMTGDEILRLADVDRHDEVEKRNRA
jgi:hypothetical protein